MIWLAIYSVVGLLLAVYVVWHGEALIEQILPQQLLWAWPAAAWAFWLLWLPALLLLGFWMLDSCIQLAEMEKRCSTEPSWEYQGNPYGINVFVNNRAVLRSEETADDQNEPQTR